MSPEQRAKPTVSIRRCTSYDGAAVDDAVRKVVGDLGGIGGFVSPGERILVKPNMLIPRRPEEAVTTHPELVRAAIRLVKEAGGEAVVGDSPAGRSTEKMLRHLADRTGIASVCDEEGVDFLLFTEGATVSYPDGRAAKSFELNSVVGEVDGIISVAKLKTHSFTRFTGAVKNLFGLIQGREKSECHMHMKDPDIFSEMLVDLAECVRPRLTIMDGVVGMDGDGPSAGRVRNVGVVLASANPHALDVAALKAVGADPGSVWTVASARRRGLLVTDDRDEGVRIVGDDLSSLTITPFRMPPKLRLLGAIPTVLGGLASETAARKPLFLGSRCALCSSCVDICPAEALSIANDAKAVDIDRDLCIRCYCCQEVCPENAVVLRRTPVRSLCRAVAARLRKMCT